MPYAFYEWPGATSKMVGAGARISRTLRIVEVPTPRARSCGVDPAEALCAGASVLNIEATKVRVKSVLPRKITMAPLHVSHTGGD